MKVRTFLILFLMVVGFGIKSFGVPSYPYPIEFTQSDKSIVTVTMRGDEKVFWALSSDGYILLRADNGDFVYAVSDNKGGMIPSSVLAHNPEDRNSEELAFVSTLNKNIFYSREQISYLKQLWEFAQDFEQNLPQTKNVSENGVETYKMVVILMSYTDIAFTTPKEEIEALFNQVGYSANGHQGSIHDYFMASSFGKLNVEATVLGPYTANNNMAYYGENYSGTNTDMRARDLVIEAVDNANPDIDFSQYTNGEGNYVSCVYVLYAGVAASSGNDPNTIWPHRSIIYPAYGVDGVYISNYGVSSEKDGYSSNPQPMVIGTICHEFSHVLGQADYYDTDYSENGSFADHGEWDLMCSGNYNNSGKCPPLWSAHEREVRGYIEIEELTELGSTTLPPLHSDNKAYKMSFNQNEYFILENRQKVGWDAYLPGHGMLIFHVNRAVSGWDMNCANCNPNYPGLDLEEANSNAYSRAGDPFPGTSNKTSFTDQTTPNSKSTAGLDLNRPITSISENSTTKNITFIYGEVDSARPVVTTVSAEGFSDSINVSATVNNAQSLSIIEKGVCFSDTTSCPTILCNTSIASTSSNQFELSLNGLQPSTTYWVRAYAKTSDKVGYGEIMKITTSCYAEAMYPFEESFEENVTALNCWAEEFGTYVSNRWSITDSAYESGAISSAAEGTHWAFIRSDWTGNGQNMKLITPPLDLSSISQAQLRFSYAQKAKSGRQDNLNVYYKTSSNASWTLLQSYTTQASSWTEATINLPATNTTYYLAFEAVLKGGYGVCLDNVEVVEADLTAFPQVNTLSYENVTDIEADITASLLSAGNNPVNTLGVCYATHSSPTIEDMMIQTAVANQYSVDLTDLQPSTTYYARAFAINSGHIGYGEEIQFTTSCQRISSYPYNVSADGSTQCLVTNGWTLSANDTVYNFTSNTTGATDKLILPIFNLDNHANTSISFDRQQAVGNNSNNDVLKVYYKTSVAGEWTLLSEFTSAANIYQRETINLVNTSNEYYIAFEGVSNGVSVNLRRIVVEATLQIPIVITNEPTLASHNSISVSGEVTYEGAGAVSQKGICWSTETNPTVGSTDANILALGAGLGEFNGTLTSLQENTTYYIRAFATNPIATVYGQEYQITTPFNPVTNNTISADQTICEGAVADNLIGSTPSGGDGVNYAYLWIMSTDGETWSESNLSSLSTARDLEMRQLFVTTYFRRVVSSNNAVDTSNVVTITVNETTRSGNVFLESGTPKVGEEFRMELRAHRGDVLRWEKRKAGFNWQEIASSQDSVFFTEVPTESGEWDYRAVVQNGVCEAKNSGSLSVNVQDGVGLYDVALGQSTIKLIPNPSNGNIILLSEKDFANITLQVVAMDGKIVHKEASLQLSSGENRMDLTSIGTGTYVLKLSSENFVWEAKLIIQQ